MNYAFNLKKRKHSHKDFSWHRSTKLGAVLLPDEFLLLSQIKNQDVEDCTAYGATAIRESEVLNGSFDAQSFWQDELSFAGVQTSDGFDVQVPAAVGVLKGFSPTGNPTIRQNYPTAYFWITPNNGQDLFDSVRSAIFQSKYPLGGGVDWKAVWTSAPQGVIATKGTVSLGGHFLKIAGWKTINGIVYIALQNSWGTSVGARGIFYITREIFNSAFRGYGIFLWSDSQDFKIKTLGRIQALWQNIIALLSH